MSVDPPSWINNRPCIYVVFCRLLPSQHAVREAQSSRELNTRLTVSSALYSFGSFVCISRRMGLTVFKIPMQNINVIVWRHG
jgi:hypothetical protein